MKAATGREKYFLLAMASLSLLLAGVLLWEWEQGMNLQRELLKLRKMPVTAVPPQKILPEFSLPDPVTGFPELLARPIFSTSRRTFVAAAPEDAGAMKKGQFVLVGVLISPRQRSALLRDVATGKTETVAQVGVVRGMTVGQVMPGRVVLRQGEETEELLLNVLTGPKLPQRAQVASTPAAVGFPARVASAPGPIASSAGPTSGAPAKPGSPPPASQPQTAQELIQAERQQQTALEQMKKQLPAAPTTTPSAAPK